MKLYMLDKCTYHLLSTCCWLLCLHRFLDKMYSMSSVEALEKFLMNPRIFLKPPNPQIPCKICVVGPPLSGKSTLARGIASNYNAMVNECIHMHDILSVSVKCFVLSVIMCIVSITSDILSARYLILSVQ